MRRFKCAFFFVVLAATAHADWTIVSSASEPGRGGIVHRHVVLENGARTERITVDLAIFSTKSCTLRILQTEDGADSLGAVMGHEKCLAGVDGGYFNENFAPLGVQIVRSREFSRRPGVTAAIQCGPFLVDRGQPIGGLNDAKVARRTFAATTTSSRTLVGVCSEVSLAELSKILATTSFADDLRIERVLNLDGGSSSGFWFARENGSAFSIPEQKPVRDFVGVVPK